MTSFLKFATIGQKGGDGMQIKKMAMCAIFSALICVCAWLAVPIGDVSITMQTFGIFLSLCLLGGKYGCISIFVYLLLGAVGLPVFSGFRGGIGVLLGTTGGYIWGFLCSGLIYWLITVLLGNSLNIRIFATVSGMITCYILGSLWYFLVYLDAETISLWAVLLKCVVPYILPDAIKLTLAHTLANKLKKYI